MGNLPTNTPSTISEEKKSPKETNNSIFQTPQLKNEIQSENTTMDEPKSFVEEEESLHSYLESIERENSEILQKITSLVNNENINSTNNKGYTPLMVYNLIF